MDKVLGKFLSQCLVKNSGYIYGLSAAFFWGLHAVLVRRIITDMPGVVIAVFRLYIAVIVLYLIQKNYRAVSTKLQLNGFQLILVAVFGVTFNFAFFHWGLEYTTASNAMLIESTAPIFVLIFLGVFYKERIKLLEFMAIVVSLMGVVFVVINDVDLDKSRLFGDALELLAAATWAIFIVGSSKVTSQLTSAKSRMSFLMVVFLIAAVPLTPAVFLMDYHISSDTIINLVLLGIFPTALAYALWYEAAARMSTVSAALIFNLSIVFTMINANIFLGESVTVFMFIGAVFIISGILLAKLAVQRKVKLLGTDKG